MSRSRKKSKYIVISGLDSNKWGKAVTNRKLRKQSKMRIESGKDPESFVLPIARETVGSWEWGKEGSAGVKGSYPDWDKFWRK